MTVKSLEQKIIELSAQELANHYLDMGFNTNPDNIELTEDDIGMFTERFMLMLQRYPTKEEIKLLIKEFKNLLITNNLS